MKYLWGILIVVLVNLLVISMLKFGNPASNNLNLISSSFYSYGNKWEIAFLLFEAMTLSLNLLISFICISSILLYALFK